MGAYLVRRLLLVVPTLFGIIAINFAVVQFAQGGPVEQMIAEVKGKGGETTGRLTGGGAGRHRGHPADAAAELRARGASRLVVAPWFLGGPGAGARVASGDRAARRPCAPGGARARGRSGRTPPAGFADERNGPCDG